jgi:hypothetical protein
MRSKDAIDADVKTALWASMEMEGADPKKNPKYEVARAGLRRFVRENPELVKEANALYAYLGETPEGEPYPVWNAPVFVDI